MKLRCLKPRLSPPSQPRGWKPDTERGNRHDRGYGYAWEKLRTQVLDRDNGLCQPCARSGRVHIATQVDHLTPKAAGGGDNLDNLQSICEPCHKAKTAREDSKAPGGRANL